MKISAVADARRHGDDRFVYEAADDAGQGTFHTSNDDADVSPADLFAAIQQAVQAGNTDVVNALYLISHDFRRQRRFFGNRNIAGTGGDDGDNPIAVDDGFILKLVNHAGQFVVLRVGNVRHEAVVHFLRSPRTDDIVILFHEKSQNLYGLPDSLPGAVYDFRKAAPLLALQIQIGKA